MTAASLNLTVLTSVGVVLHEERLLDRRLRARDVLAHGRLRVGLGAREELVLGRLVLVVLAAPDLDARRLQGARVREGEREGALAVELVDLVQVDGRVLLRDATCRTVGLMLGLGLGWLG